MSTLQKKRREQETKGMVEENHIAKEKNIEK